jgi:hypothetical protein
MVSEMIEANAPEPKETEADKIHARMSNLLIALYAEKPEDRSALSRHYAVTITEMEKVFAYFQTFIWSQQD